MRFLEASQGWKRKISVATYIIPSKKYLRLFAKHVLIFLKSREKKRNHFSGKKEDTTGLNNLENLVKRKVIKFSNSELIP